MLIGLLIGILLGIVGMVLVRFVSRQMVYGQLSKRLQSHDSTTPTSVLSDNTVMRIQTDYQAALAWQQSSALIHFARQWRDAALYFSGEYLHNHRVALQQCISNENLQLVGVLRADHQLEVRDLSPDGQECLLLDTQSYRRMATYDMRSQKRIHTQDLGAGVLIYKMVFDPHQLRWKIDAFIQELQPGWQRYYAATPGLELRSSPRPPFAGRDN